MLPRLVGIGDRVEDDPEFVAADARDGVAGAHAADEPLADGDQEPVAHRVAEALVDDLEPVEARAAPPRWTRMSSAWCAGEGVRDAVGQELAVGQPRRRVVERPALGDIDEPGVVERDGRELAEARQRTDVPAAPAPLRCCPIRDRARRRPVPPDVSGTPTTEPKMPDGNVGERPSHVS